GLRISFAGNQNTERQRNEKIRQRKKRQQKYTPVNRNAKNKSHKGKNQAQLEKANSEIRKQLAQKKTQGTHRRNKELLEGAALFLTHNGKSGQKRRHVEKQDRRQAGQKKIGRT